VGEKHAGKDWRAINDTPAKTGVLARRETARIAWAIRAVFYWAEIFHAGFFSA
jgi:hypothetical protein